MATLELAFEPQNPYGFNGWAAKIVAWPPGKPPELKFGIRTKSRWNTVILDDVEVGEVIMLGANGKLMARQDKFTYFGRIGVEDGGVLRVIRMRPREGDARALWMSPTTMNRDVIKHATSAISLISPVSGKVPAMHALECINQGLDAAGLRTTGRIGDSGEHVAVIATLLTRMDVINTAGNPELQDLLQVAKEFFRKWEEGRRGRKAEMRSEK